MHWYLYLPEQASLAQILCPDKSHGMGHPLQNLCHDDVGYNIKASNFWATPELLMEAIRIGLGANQERFASPLDFNPMLATYYSPFAEDAQFGAQYNAYSNRWTGSSQASPDSTPKEMQKAMR